jgi:hypothetical protein
MLLRKKWKKLSPKLETSMVWTAGRIAHFLRMFMMISIQFFWGEAMWGMTEGLRRLRIVRISIILLGMLSVGLVLWALIEREVVLAARINDGGYYSYYEGKVLEERVFEIKKRAETQADDIKRLLEMANTSTLLAVRMQNQLEKQQDLLDAGVKILGAVVVTPILAILWSIFKTGLRRERPKLPGVLNRYDDHSPDPSGLR